MQPKQSFLGPYVASAFQDPSVVASYRYRPPYPALAFDVLAGLIVDAPRRVLDVGCGTGFLARPLAERVDALDGVDAVDISREIIEEGRRLPSGDSPRLRWIVGRIEDVALKPPYALITAGDSLHWMEWDVVMPRFARLLTRNGALAIMGVGQVPPPWQAELGDLIRRYSTVRDYQPYDLFQEITDRGLFQRTGTYRTQPVAFVQSIDDYIASFHGRASFSRERMDPADAAAFDEALRTLVSRYMPDEVELQVEAEIVWGKPLG